MATSNSQTIAVTDAAPVSAVDVVDDVGVNSGEEMAPWSYVFATSRPMASDPDIITVETLPKRGKASPAPEIQRDQEPEL